MQFYEIAFQRKIGKDFDTLTYHYPERLEFGQSVIVSIRGKKHFGIVWNQLPTPPGYKTIAISEIIGNRILLQKWQKPLIDWLQSYYFCSLWKLLKSFIPKPVFENRKFRAKLRDDSPEKGEKTKKLNTQQAEIYKEIKANPKNNFLIHGITGSGKTEVYTKVTEDCLKQNRQVLILLPEISLTPQTIRKFEHNLGVKANVIHSKLSESEKGQTWERIKSGEASLIIGSRSAILAPYKNLGLIIIDECHEESYKQDNTPRYHAVQLAEKLSELLENCRIILGSATPTVEQFLQYQKNLLSLTERFGEAKLPQIEICDLRNEFKRGNHSIFSEELNKAIQEILAKKEQAILFLNRRGSASSVVCRDCGEKATCPHCASSLTYHDNTIKTEKMICHHCGYIGTPPTICGHCSSHNIRYLGVGTQKIESEAKKFFPTARILRADKDSTASKNSFKEIYDQFRNHQADILIGTQMIAKGLNLPKVNLVGVILADIGLNIPDFRSSERNFQLMSQVAGRAGRSGAAAKVIIQTYSPESLALKFTQNHDYQSLYKHEITQRKLLKYPPFSKLCKIIIQNTSSSECQKLSAELERKLWQSARELAITDEIEINQYPAYISKLKNKYRHIILIKDKSNSNLIHKMLGKIDKKYIIDPEIKIDIDPLNLN